MLGNQMFGIIVYQQQSKRKVNRKIITVDRYWLI